MPYADIRPLIDAKLEGDARIAGSSREDRHNESTWQLNEASVIIGASGSTGILVEYVRGGRVMHRKIFAASPQIVDRLVTTVIEHLTAYVRT